MTLVDKFGGLLAGFLGGFSGIIMDYHGLLWIIMDYEGPWIESNQFNTESAAAGWWQSMGLDHRGLSQLAVPGAVGGVS